MTCGLLGLGPSSTGEETVEAAIVFLTGFVQLLPDELQKRHGTQNVHTDVQDYKYACTYIVAKCYQ